MWQPLPRRTFLRGLGTAMALPWLEGMMPRASAAPPAAAAGAPPQRLAFLYVPNGIHMPYWKPEKTGSDFELPRTLQPLADFKNQVTLFTGLAQDNARSKGDGPGDHARSAATFLTGRHPVKTDGKDLRAGVSVDHIAAKYIGQQTRFPTLELGCEGGRLAGSCDSGYSCAYSNSISWRSPSNPAGKEVNPKLVFDRLFGNDDQRQMDQSRYRREERRQSVLDLVADDAKRLRRRVGGNDRQKLDQYLEGVREIERRVADATVKVNGDSFTRPDGSPENFGERIRLMGDMMVLAFQTDATRVATFMLANEGSNKTYPELEIRQGHHGISHHRRKAEQVEKIAKINHYHIEQFAYILGRMSETTEGDTTLLDQTVLVYGSGISDGNRHNHDDLPILVAGRGGGLIKPGRHVRYEQETPLMNLFLALLQGVGAPVRSVGDSTGPLKELHA